MTEVLTLLFVLGDKVLLHDDRVRRGRSAKLTTPWIGPYEIVDIDDVNVTLRLTRNRTLKVHANRLKPFFGCLQDHDIHAQILDCLRASGVIDADYRPRHYYPEIQRVTRPVL